MENKKTKVTDFIEFFKPVENKFIQFHILLNNSEDYQNTVNLKLSDGRKIKTNNLIFIGIIKELPQNAILGHSYVEF